MVGQLIWCLAHTLWVGSSFMLATSAGLMAHHLFGAWHGDQRLAAKYGSAFDEVCYTLWNNYLVERRNYDTAHGAVIVWRVW